MKLASLLSKASVLLLMTHFLVVADDVRTGGRVCPQSVRSL
jgi:hypothetical protein